MSRLGMLVSLLFCLMSPALSAQVIECPGFLPIANIDPLRKTALARHLLGRFIAVLDLQDLDAVDEEVIMARYQGHSEQLTIKLSYLALQCQMEVLDSEMAIAERRQAVRRVFLDYVLKPPSPEIESLTAYVNEIAANGHDDKLGPRIAMIENALDEAPRRQWQKRWFASSTDRVSEADRWSVIVSSPRYEDEGWAELRWHQLRWPDVYFELDGPFDLASPFYAVVAGRDLSAKVADNRLAKIKADGMAKDAFRWKAPTNAEGGGLPETLIDPEAVVIKPTPARPALNGANEGLLSQ